ncbi:phosphopantothenate-cysteine ligase [Salpingoeca rosetta]|uniref:Phosphopantothenate-cysteine ligase n=1 Tax=Salpingoeca rosetta (strain ATCC 50818 / BSB-021) TaxID=946362 RepID=F2UI06_SALR5|nr:phosphopantothenate-cysteine ligase [Salpingoeca rosetta]EGD76755.1 phosphopantothenate-cysteine ligase [Salpingoeca rosetta]|eukprot:XP_004991127.1 phosphopantothenate-cysteine ligase [Salpingoeca rosetta]
MDDVVRRQVDEMLSAYRPSQHFEEQLHSAEAFIDQQAQDGRLALVTSGGTGVPLEKNMVRFLDNFSRGKRGAASTEYFLDRGYAVIFFTRRGSRRPFLRALPRSPLDWYSIDKDDPAHDPTLRPELADAVHDAIRRYHEANDSGRFLEVEFFSVHDYLYGLRRLAGRLRPLGPRACLYLAAAVSDFYIADSQLAEHKIQSRDGNLSLHMEQVPKLLHMVKPQLCPECYVVTFKLETDEALLAQKARAALAAYGHEMVVANMLHRRHREVLVFTRGSDVGVEIKLRGDADDDDGDGGGDDDGKQGSATKGSNHGTSSSTGSGSKSKGDGATTTAVTNPSTADLEALIVDHIAMLHKQAITQRQ